MFHVLIMCLYLDNDIGWVYPIYLYSTRGKSYRIYELFVCQKSRCDHNVCRITFILGLFERDISFVWGVKCYTVSRDLILFSLRNSNPADENRVYCAMFCRYVRNPFEISQLGYLEGQLLGNLAWACQRHQN